MIAYVVNLNVEYEGEWTEAVFSSRALAEKFVADNPLRNRGTTLEIYEFEVDEVPRTTPS